MKRKQGARERDRIKAAAALGLVTVESVFACECGFEWSRPWMAVNGICNHCGRLNISAMIADMEPEDD